MSETKQTIIEIVIILLIISFAVMIVWDIINFFDFISQISETKDELNSIDKNTEHDKQVPVLTETINYLNQSVAKLSFDITFKVCVFVASFIFLLQMRKKYE